MPMVVPQFWPWLGRMFWSLIALIQLVLGVKDSRLYDYLEWNKKEGSDTTPTPPTEPTDASAAAETEAEALVTTTTEEVAPTEAPVCSRDSTEMLAPEIAVEATAATKSLPAISNPSCVDAVWRNCNSDITCQEKDAPRGLTFFTLYFDNLLFLFCAPGCDAKPPTGGSFRFLFSRKLKQTLFSEAYSN